MPFSEKDKFFDPLRCRGSFAYYKLSIMHCASGPKVLWAHSLSSSRKNECDFVFGSKMSLCHLCFAVACGCSLTYFRRNLISTSSMFHFLLAFLFLNVCRAFFEDMVNNG